MKGAKGGEPKKDPKAGEPKKDPKSSPKPDAKSPKKKPGGLLKKLADAKEVSGAAQWLAVVPHFFCLFFAACVWSHTWGATTGTAD